MSWTESVPPGGRALLYRGAFELRLQQGEFEILRLFDAGAGEKALQRFAVPVDADWDQFVDAYAARLDRHWHRHAVPERHHDYRLCVWERQRLGRPNARRVIALFDEHLTDEDGAEPVRAFVVAAQGD